MLIRFLDLIISFLLIIIFFPVILTLVCIIFFQDFKNPIFSSIRIGKHRKKFKLFKLRTMKINNMSSAIRTTRENDPRITFLGRWIRKYKLDEIIQLWNVIINDMSIIGPRPNVEEEIKFYKNSDFDLFKYKPGITDYASIWFINLESRLSSDSKIDVNKEYLLRIKPLKNYLALKTVKNLGIMKYLYICFLTAIAFFNLKFAKKLILQSTRKR